MIKKLVTLGEKETKKYKNKFIIEMSFEKILRQLQEEIIFGGGLKRFICEK